MKSIMRKAAALVAALAVSACASVGSGGDRSPDFRLSLGSSTAEDLTRFTRPILNFNQFQIDQSAAGGAEVYIETHWRSRPPFDDENALGVTQAETKIIVQGRERQAAAAGRVVAVDFIVRNRVRMGAGSEWTTIPATAEFKSYARTIAQQLKKDLDSATRVF